MLHFPTDSGNWSRNWDSKGGGGAGDWGWKGSMNFEHAPICSRRASARKHRWRPHVGLRVLILSFLESPPFFEDLLRARLRVIIDLFGIALLLGPYSTTPHWPKQVYIIEKTLSSNYITWKKEIYSEHWRMVMPSFSPPVVRDNKQFETTIYTTFKHWLVTTTDINNKTW